MELCKGVHYKGQPSQRIEILSLNLFTIIPFLP